MDRDPFMFNWTSEGKIIVPDKLEHITASANPQRCLATTKNLLFGSISK